MTERASSSVTRWVVALVGSLAVLGLLALLGVFDGIDITATLQSSFASLAWGPVALSFLLYALSYVGRAMRLRVLVGRDLDDVPWWHLTSICARHNLANLVLPMRSGEVSLPLMLRSETGRPLAQGAAALVVARVLDLFSVALFCVVGVVVVGAAGVDDAERELILLRLGLVVGAGVVVLAVMRPIARAVAMRVTGNGRIARFIRDLGTHLGALPTARLAQGAAISGVTWLLTYAACFEIVVAMRGVPGDVGAALTDVTFSQSLVGSTGLHLTGILPINTLAGVGAWEAGWIAGYHTIVGVPKEAALASAAVSHVLILTFIVVLAGVGFLARPRNTIATTTSATP